jgi:hypothetical protein
MIIGEIKKEKKNIDKKIKGLMKILIIKKKNENILIKDVLMFVNNNDDRDIFIKY